MDLAIQGSSLREVYDKAISNPRSSHYAPFFARTARTKPVRRSLKSVEGQAPNSQANYMTADEWNWIEIICYNI